MNCHIIPGRNAKVSFVKARGDICMWFLEDDKRFFHKGEIRPMVISLCHMTGYLYYLSFKLYYERQVCSFRKILSRGNKSCKAIFLHKGIYFTQVVLSIVIRCIHFLCALCVFVVFSLL